MSTHDARHESEEALQLMRRQAHRLRHQEGLSWSEIGRLIGVGKTALTRWVQRYRMDRPQLGEVASRSRGRTAGSGRTLEPAQEVLLRQAMLEHAPEELGIAQALWTREAVRQAVAAKFAVDMPLRTVSEYLRRWGFTPQRPAKRAAEQDAARVGRWLQVDYPAIEARARAEGAAIFWADETAVRQDAAWVRGFAPAGQTPSLVHAARWEHVSMISAISGQGLVRFALHEGSIDTARFIDFLARLLRDQRGRKAFVVVDNLRVHHAKAVGQWLRQDDHQERIELFYLPPYSPEHNPDEWLNRDLKTHLRSAPQAKDTGALRQLVHAFVARLKARRGQIKSYFTHEHTAYANGWARISVPG